MLPSARYTSASTVGFPRESRISLPSTFVIVIFFRSRSFRCKDYSLAGCGSDRSRARQQTISCHNRNSAIGHVIACGAGGCGVEADLARIGNLHTGVNDGTADPAVSSDLD